MSFHYVLKHPSLLKPASFLAHSPLLPHFLLTLFFPSLWTSHLSTSATLLAVPSPRCGHREVCWGGRKFKQPRTGNLCEPGSQQEMGAPNGSLSHVRFSSTTCPRFLLQGLWCLWAGCLHLLILDVSLGWRKWAVNLEANAWVCLCKLRGRIRFSNVSLYFIVLLLKMSGIAFKWLFNVKL